MVTSLYADLESLCSAESYTATSVQVLEVLSSESGAEFTRHGASDQGPIYFLSDDTYWICSVNERKEST